MRICPTLIIRGDLVLQGTQFGLPRDFGIPVNIVLVEPIANTESIA